MRARDHAKSLPNFREMRNWPKADILLRADSHYGTPEVLDLCDSHGLRYVFGAPLKIALNPALRYDPGAKPAWEFDDGADGFL